MLIDGYIDEIKEHFVREHGIATSRKAKFPFKCSKCGSIYWYFKNFKKHILEYHPVRAHERTASVTETERADSVPLMSTILNPSDSTLQTSEPEELSCSIQNPFFYEQDITSEEAKAAFAKLITELRCDVALPESKLQKFMKGFVTALHWAQRYTMSRVKNYIAAKNGSIQDEATVDFINDLLIPDITSDVKTPEDNVVYLSAKLGCPIAEPREIVLGQTKTTTRVMPTGNRYHQRLTGIKYTTKKLVQKEVVQYISIIDTLRTIVLNPEARAMIRAEKHQKDGEMYTYKDGQQYRNHEYLSRYPDAVRLSIHIDEGEYSNPLGSRKGKNKLTNICFKIQNFDSRINSSLDRIYIALVVKSSVLKKHGYEKVLTPLIDELLILESEEGVNIKVNTGFFRLRGVLVSVLGDTLAIHDIFGLLGPSANLFCRTCLITRKDLVMGALGDNYVHRTANNVEDDLDAIENKYKSQKDCGIKERCVLHRLQYFRWTNNHCFDPMHDLLEGVVPMVLKKILNISVQKNVITCSEINQMILNFEYGKTESADKPSPNFSHTNLQSKGNALSQSAAQCWLLLRAFPFIFNKILRQSERFACLVSTLLKICFISFSNKITAAMVNDLQDAIDKFQKLFKECFPTARPINKCHHISHYPQQCTEIGPICYSSCMMFESKFKESKSQGKSCNNVRNLPYSLAKRLSLKQANSILHHNYTLDKPSVISFCVISKQDIDSSALLFDYPTMIKLVKHLKINGTDFKPGFVVKFELCSELHLGILLMVAQHINNFAFIIQELEMIDFDTSLYAVKVNISQNIIRVDKDKLYTKKTYSLWQNYGDGSNDCNTYISLKYKDD